MHVIGHLLISRRRSLAPAGAVVRERASPAPPSSPMAQTTFYAILDFIVATCRSWKRFTPRC